MDPRVPVPLHQHEQQATGQSVGSPNVNTLPEDTVSLVQQFMTEFKRAVLEEEKIVVITKIVLNLMMQNGH
jgi:hypothetical protein